MRHSSPEVELAYATPIPRAERGPTILSSMGPLVLLAWPTVITYMAFAIRQLADTWMAGRLGTDAQAGILAAQQILLTILGFGFGMFSALNTCASHAEEREGSHGAVQYAWQCVWLAVFLGVLSLGFYWLAQPIFGALNHGFAVYTIEVNYFTAALFAVLPQFVAVSISNYFFAIRKPFLPMLVGIGYVALNITLNWLLMFGVEGLFHGLGVAGAAWGTVIASTFWGLVMLGLFMTMPLESGRNWLGALNLERMRSLLKLGLPNGMIDLVDVFFWNVAVVVLIGSFGVEHLAASAIMISLWNTIIVPGNGQAVALQTLIGHLVAAGKKAAAHLQLGAGLLIIITVMGGAGVSCYWFRDEIFSFMSMDPGVRAIGVQCMILFPIIILMDGAFFGIDSALNGAGDAVWPMVAAFLCHLTIILGLGWAVGLLFPQLGSFGIWLCILLNRGLLAFLVAKRWTSGGWDHARPLGA